MRLGGVPRCAAGTRAGSLERCTNSRTKLERARSSFPRGSCFTGFVHIHVVALGKNIITLFKLKKGGTRKSGRQNFGKTQFGKPPLEIKTKKKRLAAPNRFVPPRTSLLDRDCERGWQAESSEVRRANDEVRMMGRYAGTVGRPSQRRRRVRRPLRGRTDRVKIFGSASRFWLCDSNINLRSIRVLDP